MNLSRIVKELYWYKCSIHERDGLLVHTMSALILRLIDHGPVAHVINQVQLLSATIVAYFIE